MNGYCKRQGFTLIELMAAMVLLVVVMVLITQIVSSVSKLTDLSKRKMDSISQITFALDRLDADFSRALKRADLLPYIQKQAGNDRISVYAQVPGYTGVRTLSAVSYSVMPTDEGPGSLLRGVTGSGWTSQPVNFSTTLHAGDVVLDPADNQVLSSSVYRFEVGFIDRETGDYKETPDSPDWSDIGGVVISLAALDEANRKLLGSDMEAAVQSATGWLGDFTVSEGPPATGWQKILESKAAAGGQMNAILSRTRIRERTYVW